jgi:uncharacterized protein
MPKLRVEPRLSVPRVMFGDPKRRGLEYVWLGNLAELQSHRTMVSLDVSTEHVVAIVGKRGSGKSFSLGVLVEGLSAIDRNGPLGALTPSHAVILLDSLNIYWATTRPVPADPSGISATLVEQAELLRAWKLSPAGVDARLWAPAGFVPAFLGDEAEEFTFSIGEFTSQDWGDLFGVDVVREPMGQAVDEAWTKVTSAGWISGDGSEVGPPATPSLSHVVECLEDDRDLGKHYSPETLRAVAQRFRALATHSVFGSVGTPLSELLKPGRVAILLLGGVPDDMRRVFVSVLARRLLDQRSAASGAAKRAALGLEARPLADPVPPTWLMIDEAQNLLPSRQSTAATQALVRFVREGRNVGLSFAVTTQQPSAIDSRIMAQVDTLIAHQLATPTDIKAVTENLKGPAPRRIKYGERELRLADVFPQLDVGQALISSPELPRSIFVAMRPRVTMHGGFEA